MAFQALENERVSRHQAEAWLNSKHLKIERIIQTFESRIDLAVVNRAEAIAETDTHKIVISRGNQPPFDEQIVPRRARLGQRQLVVNKGKIAADGKLKPFENAPTDAAADKQIVFFDVRQVMCERRSDIHAAPRFVERADNAEWLLELNFPFFFINRRVAVALELRTKRVFQHNALVVEFFIRQKTVFDPRH